MYWSNYHSHCTFCDGRSSMEDFVKFAIAKALKSYGFSSHAPLPFRTKWAMVEDDFSEYKQEFERLKQKYSHQIDLFLGMEVDFIDNCSNVQNAFFQNNKVDYIIGSIHFLDKMPNGDYWCIDGEFPEFDKGLKLLYDGDIKLATKRFFEITSLMLEKDGFDIVGHLDKIAYNGHYYKHFDISQNWYKNLMGDTLLKVKAKNKILEINTKSLIGLGFTYPNKQFFSLINDLEIPIVVNSDCHYPTNILDSFKPTFNALKNAGFNTMQILKNYKWQAVEFNKDGLIME